MSARVRGAGRNGAGVVTGNFEFEKDYRSASGESLVARDEGRVLGIAVGAAAELGVAFDSRLAVGAFARLEIAPYVIEASPRYSSVNGHVLTAFGPSILYRPEPSFELRLAPEWTFARFVGSQTDIGAEDNVFEFENVSGPGVQLSLAYRSESGWGVATVTDFALLSGTHTHFTPFSLSLLAGWSSW